MNVSFACKYALKGSAGTAPLWVMYLLGAYLAVDRPWAVALGAVLGCLLGMFLLGLVLAKKDETGRVPR